ncbi:MAG: bifunctional oligoribonuclease/PAP phosphatase NrnA [Deltaproteobacteria bacterium]|nr:bifunctional oligoribonuclease/PAP phosphatase NrnA [Deltaproteobacteria bacterium]
MTETALARATAFFSRHQHYCIASHIRPDGDAIGASLALGLGLIHCGKRVTVFNADGVPANLRFLPYADRVVRSLGESVGIDAVILADCNRPDRAGEPIAELAKRLPLFIVDHHVSSGEHVETHCIEPRAAATGEIVYHLLQRMRVPTTPELATLLYCTLVVDTGQFRYSNATPAVFQLAAELVARGADPWQVASALTEQHHPAVLHLLRLTLETLELSVQGRVATILLSQDMLREAEALPEYAEDFVNYPRSIAGVEVAILLRELPDGRWKASLRSKREVDVAVIAAKYDGGGHEHAAGCMLSGPMATARDTILKSVAEALQKRANRAAS